MHSYSVYNLCLHSDIPLPGLPESRGAPDIVVRNAPLDPAEVFSGRQGGSRVSGHYDDRLLVEVKDGREITVHEVEPVGEETIRAYVTSVLLAIALRQRGLLLLHASCVARDGAAIAFLGESGWGKSTLAEAFLQRGYSVLTDDILAIDLRDDRVARVIPGPPYIRLRPEAGGLLVDDYESLAPVSSLTDQRMKTIGRSSSAEAVLKRIYVLDPDDSAYNAIEPLPRLEATMHLLTHSWGKRAFTDPDFRTRHLNDCAALVRSLPIQRLRRVRSLHALPEHVQLIEADLTDEE